MSGVCDSCVQNLFASVRMNCEHVEVVEGDVLLTLMIDDESHRLKGSLPVSPA